MSWGRARSRLEMRGNEQDSFPIYLLNNINKLYWCLFKCLLDFVCLDVLGMGVDLLHFLANKFIVMSEAIKQLNVANAKNIRILQPRQRSVER